MKKIYFENLEEYLEQEIIVEGFVDSIRDLQYVQFLVIRDITGKVQVTIEKNAVYQTIPDEEPVEEVADQSSEVTEDEGIEVEDIIEEATADQEENKD